MGLVAPARIAPGIDNRTREAASDYLLHKRERGAIKGRARRRLFLAGYFFGRAEALKALVEARELAAIDQALLAAGPRRMRFRIDVEPQCVAGLAIGRARLVRRAVGHHDVDLV